VALVSTGDFGLYESYDYDRRILVLADQDCLHSSIPVSFESLYVTFSCGTEWPQQDPISRKLTFAMDVIDYMQDPPSESNY
jgi:hypothetical protein